MLEIENGNNAELPNEDEILEQNVQKLMERHKQYKKQFILDKDLTGNKMLLQKYDTCRALALKLRSKVTDERVKSARPTSPTKPNSNPNMNEENPETVIISSPKRGKIRPRSAPITRTRKNEEQSKSSNHFDKPQGNYDFSPPSSPSPPNNQSKTRLGFTSQNQPVPANTLNHDEWWLLGNKPKEKTKTKTKSKDPSKDSNQPMTQHELKEHLKKTRENKPKRIPPSTYLAEYKEKEERHLRDIAITVMEEAYLMESRAYGCVEEANAYAKALGIRKKYSIFTRTVDENNHIRKIAKSSSEYLLPTQKLQPSATTTSLPGTLHGQQLYQNYDLMRESGKRIEKMMIEVMTVPGEPTQLLALDKFYAEHNKLQMELRKKRNLMTKSEKIKNYEIENNEITKDINGSNKRRGIKDGGGSETAPGGGGGQSERKNPTEINLEDIQKLQQKDEKTKKELKNISKQITEEKLVKILEETKNVTAVLENQLKELKLRGWNESIK